MSMREQEYVQLALIFDADLQQQFCEHGLKALDKFSLTAQEKNDFSFVRKDNLKLDAVMRRHLILAQLSKDLPLTFSVFSSLDDGMGYLQSALSLVVILSPPDKRVVAFIDALMNENRPDERLLTLINAEAEMAASSARLKKSLLENNAIDKSEGLSEDELDFWDSSPIVPAPYVITALLPESYQQIKNRLCPVTGSALWKHLQNNPLPKFMLEDVLSEVESCCFIAKAVVSEYCDCDPVIEQSTQTLNEGFFSLLQQLDGHTSINELLAALRHAGANDELLLSIKKTFYQLLQTGMLKVVTRQN